MHRDSPTRECKLTNTSNRLHYLSMMENTTRRRVARALRAGGPEVLEVGFEDLAPLKAGEVLVRVEATGLNHAERLIRSGTYSIRFPFPYAVGLEGAGTVEAVGPAATLAPGTRVCWTAVFGSCANFVVAPASMLAPLPGSLSFEDGASLAHGAVTAAGLVRHCPLDEGSTAVVWGAAAPWVCCSWPSCPIAESK